MDNTERRSALSQGLHYLSRRRLSVWELDQRLRRARYSQEEREQAIAKLQEWAYLDDGEFARAYCCTKKEQSSRQKIACDLSRKGVSREDIAGALEQEYSEEEELRYCRRRMLRAWGKHSLPSDFLDAQSTDDSSKYNWNSLVEAFKGRFARKGYPYATIQTIVEEAECLFFPNAAKET
jgi:regulatory protein